MNTPARAGRRPHDVEVEQAHPAVTPSTKRAPPGRHDEREHEHDETQPVDGQVEADAELRDPGDVDLSTTLWPRGDCAASPTKCRAHIADRQAQAGQRRGQRRPAGQRGSQRPTTRRGTRRRRG